MGGVCGCLRGQDYESLFIPENSVFRNCSCLRYFLRSAFNSYVTIFGNGEVRSSSSPVLLPSSSQDSSLSGMYRSPPMPLPYDADTSSQSGGREKGSGHSHEETDSFIASDKWKPSCEEASDEPNHKSALKLSSAKNAGVIGYVYPLEDDDFCPTCLEEYTVENPKITTKCSHHFHLSCIYEWMERSDSCPVCGKVMAFNEP